MSNDWYEKKELPPVGAQVYSPIMSGVVVAIPDAGGDLVCVKTHDGRLALYNYQGLKPITNADCLVFAVEKILDGCESVSNRAIAHAIINAGYRKVEPMTEEEFIAQICISFDVDEEFCRELYQGGCRFIKQGE